MIIFVGGLRQATPQNHLEHLGCPWWRGLCAQYGEIVDVNLVRDRDTGKSRVRRSPLPPPCISSPPLRPPSNWARWCGVSASNARRGISPNRSLEICVGVCFLDFLKFLFFVIVIVSVSSRKCNILRKQCKCNTLPPGSTLTVYFRLPLTRCLLRAGDQVVALSGRARATRARSQLSLQATLR